MTTSTLTPSANTAGAQPLSPQVRELLELRPLAYWRTFVGETLLFKIACIYLIFEYVRPQSIWPAIDILPFGFLSLVIGVGLALFMREPASSPVHGSKMGLLAAFTLYAVLSILASSYSSYGFEMLPILVSWVFAYLLITKAVNNEQRFLFFYVLFLLVSFKMSQHGMRLWAASGFAFNKDGVHGAPGWFHNSGEVGIQMAIFFPMAVLFVISGWKSWNKWLKLGSLVVLITIVGTILGSSSRGALIGLIVVSVWMLGISRYKFRALIGLAAMGVVVALALPPEFYARLDAMGEDSSSTNRLEYWKWGWEMMKEHPLLGIGYFAWQPQYGQYLIDISAHRKPELCHNILIQAGSELGFPGLIMELALIAGVFGLNRRARKLLGDAPENALLRNLTRGLDGGMIGYVISAQFVTVLYYPYQWIAIALSVALYNVVHRKMRPAERSQQRWKRRDPRKQASAAPA